MNPSVTRLVGEDGRSITIDTLIEAIGRSVARLRRDDDAVAGLLAGLEARVAAAEKRIAEIEAQSTGAAGPVPDRAEVPP